MPTSQMPWGVFFALLASAHVAVAFLPSNTLLLSATGPGRSLPATARPLSERLRPYRALAHTRAPSSCQPPAVSTLAQHARMHSASTCWHAFFKCTPHSEMQSIRFKGSINAAERMVHPRDLHSRVHVSICSPSPLSLLPILAPSKICAAVHLFCLH